MKTSLTMGAAVLILAACNSNSGAGGNGSAVAGGGGSSSAVSLQPGEWEMKTEVVSVNAPDLPAGVAESMKRSAGKTSRSCMTAEEAKGPKADMFDRHQPGANCKSEGYSWAGGRIAGKTTCTGEGGAAGKAVVTMSGRYDAQSLDMTLKSENEIAGRAMTMEMRISGKRVGECPAGGVKEG